MSVRSRSTFSTVRSVELLWTCSRKDCTPYERPRHRVSSGYRPWPNGTCGRVDKFTRSRGAGTVTESQLVEVAEWCFAGTTLKLTLIRTDAGASQTCGQGLGM